MPVFLLHFSIEVCYIWSAILQLPAIMPDAQAQEVDPSTYATHVKPEGLAAVVLGVCIGLAAASIITMVLRVWVRTRTSQFGLDDWLMTLGLVSREILEQGQYLV